jgi:hypothetical protein
MKRSFALLRGQCKTNAKYYVNLMLEAQIAVKNHALSMHSLMPTKLYRREQRLILTAYKYSYE